ncbi:MAG: 23S rRNA (guanosine(2251)-2'-O)-methyltransferase RlmB [Candidatus Altiarchaeota archaeon]|nr:23S rRNA (guanosine(2251)-2'-O)-methyltransferase RlmB [Candidatus Altiarchaeota archaeon]
MKHGVEGDRVYGKNAVMEALRGSRRIKEVYISTTANKGFADGIIGALKPKGIRFQFRNPGWLKRFTGSDSHQGIAAVVERMGYCSVKDILRVAESKNEQPFLLILDGIEDPQNLGSMIRSAECAGVHGIIIPESRAVGITGSVVKVASGATEYVKISRVGKLKPLLRELRDSGIKIIGTDANAKTKYYNVPMREGVAIVVGNEGGGMRNSVADGCDMLVSIPMRGRIDSLNVAVSAAILMFEVVRQRVR